MSAVDLASAIGTWVAAGLGIIALVGIIGPVLVWRASRTDRHKALDVLERTNTDFISKGYKAGPNIRLGRKIKAPILSSEPRQLTRDVVYNAASKRAALESPSWVKLGLIFRAYGLDYQLGDSLIIEDQSTLLPVNRTWVLLLGIIGGFAKRPDQGKVGGPFQAQPTARGANINALGRDQQPTPGWMTSRLKWASSRRGGSTYGENLSDGQYKYSPIHGFTATLYMLSRSSRSDSLEKEKAFLNLHTLAETGDLPQYPVPLSHLFWLSVGCIPTAEGKVFSLENVASLAAVPQVEVQVDYSGPVSPHVPMGRGVRFDEDESDDNDLYDDPYRGNPHGAFANTISPNNFITPTSMVVDPGRHVDPYRSRVFYLHKTADRNPALEGIAQAVNARFDDVYSLDELEITDEMAAEFKAIGGATYVPSDSHYVRLGSNDPVYKGYTSAWFLVRKDAQVLAQAILSLPLYSQGYLLGGSHTSNARIMLCESAEALPQLLGRMVQSKAALGLEAADKEEILSTLHQMYLRTLKYDKTRLNAESIFKLDHALLACLHPDPKINLAIGVLVITNAEFRAMITQSARHIESAAQSSIFLSFQFSRIEVASIFGIPQSFPIDFDVLCSGEVLPEGEVEVSYDNVLMAAVKAMLRSTFLQTSVNSLPLFSKVMAADETIYFV